MGQLRWLLVKAGTGGELAARSPLSGASKEREREPGRTRHRLTLRSQPRFIIPPDPIVGC